MLTPAGAYGPAFLALENFLVIKRYNMSDLYALFVGNLGDRIAGGGDFVTPWADVQQLSAKGIEGIQEGLQAQGYAVAKIDGKAGMNTRSLIGAYQKANSLKVDCWPTEALLTHVRAKAPAKAAAGQGCRSGPRRSRASVKPTRWAVGPALHWIGEGELPSRRGRALPSSRRLALAGRLPHGVALRLQGRASAYRDGVRST